MDLDTLNTLGWGFTNGALMLVYSPLFYARREMRDRYDKPDNPTLAFTELGIARLAAKGHEAPEPLELDLELEWRPLLRRERVWVAWVAPGTTQAILTGVVKVYLPPMRKDVAIKLQEWGQPRPKKPRKPPRGGLRIPSLPKLRPSSAPGFA